MALPNPSFVRLAKDRVTWVSRSALIVTLLVRGVHRQLNKLIVLALARVTGDIFFRLFSFLYLLSGKKN